MENWEFLLQKEGDRAWLPLESPDVEILEGRYRVVARSTLANAEIEVRITHQLTDEVPPQRRVQKRSTRTNPEGLMVVIPYTSLKPGIWELCCLENSGGDSGEISQHLVQLQVLPTEDYLELEESFSPTTEDSTSTIAFSQPEGTTTISEASVSAIAKPADIPTSQEAEPSNPSPEKLEATQVQTSVDNNAENSSPKAISAEAKTKLEKLRGRSQRSVSPLTEKLSVSPLNSTPDTLDISEFDLRLTLEKQSYVAQLGQPLIIYGQVEIAEKSELSNSKALTPEIQAERLQRAIAKLQVQICLRDPQTGKVLVDTRQTLPQQLSPCIFACVIYLPSECKTRLMLGEAVLLDGTTLLGTESFTITARLEDLLEVIVQNFSEENHQVTTPETLAKQEEANLNQSFANLTETLKEATPGEFPLSPRGQLPPQITTRPGAIAPNQSLDLPAFGQGLSDSSGKMSSSEIAPLLVLAANLEKKPKSEESKVVPLFKATPTFSDLLVTSVPEESKETNDRPSINSEASTNSELDANTGSDSGLMMSEPQLADSPPAVEQGFRGLKLQDRFLTRLSSLANDTEFSDWLKASMPPSPESLDIKGEEGLGEILTSDGVEGKSIPEDAEINGGDRQTSSATPGKPDWVAREFVVFDDPLPSRQVKKVNVEVESDRQGQTQRTPYVLPEEEPVPTPVLDVLSKEIVAGRLIKVRVRLPELMPRIYVKIWVYDRQSYVILDGPRWIAEFSPNGLGNIEAIAELEIAYGSLEVEFEAIAVEMQTLRESHKATVHRRVVPPSAPSLPLDK
ncbi:hypothetical protein [Kamptonema sp. UHCC 0994]|uniref:hypothetical protein n=1 Tax=Kamptonema sp. UHCC 0994 TaxID=3031329 RepID=UPI0023BABDF4|nr:hypothetical protein [Kamptonema sp. UHCC 0994]MDF0556231.1 hypothetical protein [Kamptonema sp. UHCC 0994]